MLLLDHDGDPDCAALSYVWGAASNPRHKITIEGRWYYIHENLYRFLNTHGVHGMSNLFIDAICIDQQNLKEQNHQVGLMSTIFARASKVIMWLGPGNNFTDELLSLVEAFDVAQHKSEACKSDSGIWETVDSDMSNSKMEDSCIVHCENYPGKWHIDDLSLKEQFMRRGWQLEEATKLIYEQPYWTRTWIIQEILLARRLQLVCGKKRINWHAWM